MVLLFAQPQTLSIGIDTHSEINKFQLSTATKLAKQLHAHSVHYAHKLVSTRRAVENNNTSYSQVLQPGALLAILQIPISFFFSHLVVEGTHGSL